MKYYFLGQIKCPGSEQVDMGPFVIPSTGGPDLTRGRTFTITLVPTTLISISSTNLIALSNIRHLVQGRYPLAAYMCTGMSIVS
jgi:hypothetical protein